MSATNMLREFLESSTIHGLSHISQAKSWPGRVLWILIVVACFGLAMYMITNSYIEWQTSPVSTTSTTHPISDLKFPTVTVCPPRGTNTALNFVLEKMKRKNFTGGKRQELRKVVKKVFLEIPAKTYASQMMKGMSIETMK